MGIDGTMPSPSIAPENQVTPNVSVTVAVTGTEPIPVAPLLLPSTGDYGSWGTES
jgi:hypothetical protein